MRWVCAACGVDRPRDETAEATAKHAVRCECKAVKVGPFALPLASVIEAFKSMDTRQDGKLTRIEVIKGVRHDPRVRELLGLPQKIRQEDGTRAAFEAVFQAMDLDESKHIELDEFIKFTTHLSFAVLPPADPSMRRLESGQLALESGQLALESGALALEAGLLKLASGRQALLESGQLRLNDTTAAPLKPIDTSRSEPADDRLERESRAAAPTG